MIKKIIVHNGQFHADDVMAITILRSMLDLSNDVPIERVNNVSEEDLNDFDVVVMDVGGRYEPTLNNFDHHQDVNLESACVLVARKFIQGDILPSIMKQLLTPISDNDRGLSLYIPATISSIVAQFNGMKNGFDRALTICQDVFNAYWFNTVRAFEDKDRWDDLLKLGNVAVITGKNAFIVSWRTFAEADGINYLICPSDREQGQWNLISRDSELFPVPVEGNQVFRHASGFMAVYSNYDDVMMAVFDDYMPDVCDECGGVNLHSFMCSKEHKDYR